MVFTRWPVAPLKKRKKHIFMPALPPPPFKPPNTTRLFFCYYSCATLWREWSRHLACLLLSSAGAGEAGRCPTNHKLQDLHRRCNRRGSCASFMSNTFVTSQKADSMSSKQSPRCQLIGASYNTSSAGCS